MSATDSQPLSLNLQSPNWFAFNVKRLPSVSYFCQTVKIPNKINQATKSPTPSLDIWHMGDHLIYEPLIITFLVDTNLQNWLEISNWMEAMTNPDNQPYPMKTLEKASRLDQISAYGLYSDITMFQTDANRNPSLEYTFFRAFPIILDGPKYDTTVASADQVAKMTSTVVFRYTKYSVKRP